MSDIGDRIKEMREALGISQAELAEKVGVKRNTVSSWETLRRPPSNGSILFICRQFGVSQAWLEAGIGSMFAQKTKSQALGEWAGQLVSRGLRDDFVARLVKVVANLDSNDLKTLERIAHQLVDVDDGRVE